MVELFSLKLLVKKSMELGVHSLQVFVNSLLIIKWMTGEEMIYNLDR